MSLPHIRTGDQALAERAPLLERARVFAAHAVWDDDYRQFSSGRSVERDTGQA